MRPRGGRVGDAGELARHPAEGAGGELHLGERVARGGVESGADEHELRRVGLEHGQDDALEGARRTRRRRRPPRAAR